jgi:hypothetical protein
MSELIQLEKSTIAPLNPVRNKITLASGHLELAFASFNQWSSYREK